jgi:hypothetical protein
LFQQSEQDLEGLVLQMNSSAIFLKFAGFYAEFERAKTVTRQIARLDCHKTAPPALCCRIMRQILKQRPDSIS